MRIGDVIIGAGIGIVVGFAAGLFAPESTRKAAHDAVDKAVKTAKSIKVPKRQAETTEEESA
jgi:gas vesicle protein